METRRALAGWPKARTIVGGGIADYMQADRFVRIGTAEQW